MINNEKLDRFKGVVFGPKPQKTPKYSAVDRRWGWSSEIIYKWRNYSYDNAERRLASSYR
jgi:hypothetical protein